MSKDKFNHVQGFTLETFLALSYSNFLIFCIDVHYIKIKLFHYSIVKKVNFPDERIIAIDFWDVPSHVDPEMVKEYLKNADAAIGEKNKCRLLIKKSFCI